MGSFAGRSDLISDLAAVQSRGRHPPSSHKTIFCHRGHRPAGWQAPIIIGGAQAGYSRFNRSIIGRELTIEAKLIQSDDGTCH